MTHPFGRHGYSHGFAHNGFWKQQAGNWGGNWKGHHWRGYGGYGWYGSVFWPYAFGDAFAFALWPYDYYDPFWGYGPDWIIASLFWPYGEPGYYDYGGGNYVAGGDYGDIYGAHRLRRGMTSVATDSIPPEQQRDACGSLAPGVDQFRVERIEKAIAPTSEEQRQALRDVNAAIERGGATMKEACPAEAPLTPPAKLDAVINRLTAIKTAISDVREPLDKLYGLLSEDQQRRFDRALLASRPGKSQQPRNLDMAKLCSDRGQTFADLPAAQIEKTVSLDDAQRSKLDALKTASTKARDISKDACISELPETIGGRLDATEKRVDSLIEAANMLKPAVNDFYSSLTDEQKARFNAMSGTAEVSRGAPTSGGSTGAGSGEGGQGRSGQ